MAKVIVQKIIKNEIKRPGVHAKTKQSNNKGAQNYVKPNVGQGK